ncbi:hypothetical protein [Nostoc sp. TCL240-02]|uniref:hypothetical protein n=1 Tax=Nostoc sp. TCL240-02 TaxID=2572090 RepID=UPI00157FB590|nr:hypothetical protein [Nostoc sp. TCL240-02]QKQ76347.1 hypothetical protein FBB35_26420 [Nostoc sp. TCL240-02]
MAEPTLQQVFGANAVQDDTTITITKSDLVSVGLTASSTNRAEALFAAILLKAKTSLTSDNQTSNADQSITIANGFVPSYTVRDAIQYRQDDITVSLQKPAGSLALDPDDY